MKLPAWIRILRQPHCVVGALSESSPIKEGILEMCQLDVAQTASQAVRPSLPQVVSTNSREIVRAKFWSIRDGLLAQRSWGDKTEHKDAEHRLEEERWSGCHGARYSSVSERRRTIWKSQELAANTFQRDTPTQFARTTNCKLNQPDWSQDVLRQTAK